MHGSSGSGREPSIYSMRAKDVIGQVVSQTTQVEPDSDETQLTHEDETQLTHEDWAELSKIIDETPLVTMHESQIALR